MEMTVPAQVQQQMEQANALQSQLYGAKEATAPAENTPAPEAAAPAEAPEVAETKQAVAPDVPAAPASEDFKHKYDVLNGKYVKEVPRLYEQLKERDAQMKQMAERLAELEKKPEQTDERLVTEKDGEAFGDDLIDLARRAAKEEIRGEMKKLVAAIDSRFEKIFANLGQVQEKVVESEADNFWGRVMSLVPDWQQIDTNESWIAFLDTRIPGTRKTRRQEAAEAIAAGDPEPIKELVDLWRGAHQPVEKPQPAKQNQAELQRQLAPSTTKANTSQPAAQKVFSAAEYEYLFSNKALHEIAPAQLEAMQREAQTALAEGRVRW